MSNYVLFLDDERFPADALKASFAGDIVICRSFDEAVAQVKSKGLPAHTCFDHDLGNDSKTGHDFAKWLVNWAMDEEQFDVPPRIYYSVHSQNPVGVENIKGVVDGYNRWREESLKL